MNIHLSIMNYELRFTISELNTKISQQPKYNLFFFSLRIRNMYGSEARNRSKCAWVLLRTTLNVFNIFGKHYDIPNFQLLGQSQTHRFRLIDAKV